MSFLTSTKTRVEFNGRYKFIEIFFNQNKNQVENFRWKFIELLTETKTKWKVD